MNSFFLIFLGLPIIEVFLMIKIGGKIGALNTVSLIFLTAFVGIYFAKIESVKTMKSGLVNFYKNKTPIYEIISGASIAIAALLLIVPGFISDTIGLLLLIPYTRKILIYLFVKRNKINPEQSEPNTVDGEIIEDKKDEL